VDPGRHVVVVSSPGRWDHRYEVDLREGQDKELLVSPGEELPPSVTAMQPYSHTDLALPPPVTSDGSPRRTAAYVLGGVGGASLLTGGVFGVAALSLLSASNAHCTGNTCASQDAINQFHTAQSFALVADVTMGVGVACIATAVVLGLTGSHGSRVGDEASLPLWVQGRF
jgi:hypothetical protein